jgi:hypothetical protein
MDVVHEHVTFWCRICSTDVFGPYSFKAGRAVTDTGDCYHEVITTFQAAALENMTGNQQRNFWFQQDGATCNTAQDSMVCLIELFPGWMTSHF